MGKSILEKSIENRKDVKELLLIFDDVSNFLSDINKRSDDVYLDIIENWKKFVKYITSDIPGYITQYTLNTIPHIISYISERKNRKDILNGKLTMAEAIRRADGWDQESFLMSRLLDISITLGADINSLSGGIPFKSRGIPSIHYASYLNNYNIVSTLINRGADVNIKCNFQKLPLHYSFINEKSLDYYKENPNSPILRKYITTNSEKIKKALINSTKDINSIDKNHKSALHYASSSTLFRKGDALNYLLSNGSNPNLKDLKGNTSLHCAAIKNNYKFIPILLNYKANINSLNMDGQTPLHLAVINNNPKIINQLVELGADKNIKDNYGKTPFDYLKNEISKNQKKPSYLSL
jgi:ankyrin repeat protein